MIIPGSLRDYSFIAANMRAEDWAEISAQVPPDTTPLDVALWCLSGRETYTAISNHQPAAAFGVHNMTPAGNVLSLWLWAIKVTPRVAFEVSKYIRENCADRWVNDEGVTRLECRSIDAHYSAHRWLRSLGASEQALPEWGRSGEAFTLFSWTKEQWLKSIGSDHVG